MKKRITLFAAVWIIGSSGEGVESFGFAHHFGK